MKNKRIILLLAVVLAIGLVGVGYAKWNNSLDTYISIQTGLLKPTLSVDDAGSSSSYGDIGYSVSRDGLSLYIDGEVYPGFNESLTIEIVDEGTVPYVLNDLRGGIQGIVSLDNSSRSGDYLILDINVDNYESLDEYDSQAYIGGGDGPVSEAEGEASIDAAILAVQGSIADLESQILSLEEEIEIYNSIAEEYEFGYKLSFEQDPEYLNEY